MILLENITRSFDGRKALDSVGFSVEGGVVGFLGENGAGKTTTFRILLGLLAPDSGRVELLGRPVRGTDDHAVRSRIGYCPSDDLLYDRLTFRENLELVSRLRTGDESAWKRREDWLSRFELEDALDIPFEAGSTGMRKKLQLLASTVGEPDILLWDEPSNGLDVASVIRMKDLVREWGAKPGRLVFFSSHQIDTVEDLCDRVLILHRGRLAADIRPEAGATLRDVGLTKAYLDATVDKAAQKDFPPTRANPSS
jgi:ABC-2 type transport system ATP-binding protein